MKIFPKVFSELSIDQLQFVFKELKLPCSNCGWNETICDIHHIIAVKNNGSNHHSNLTQLCPNCHRKAHEGTLKTFISVEGQIGEKWKTIYSDRRARWAQRLKEAAKLHQNISKHNAGRKLIRDENATEIVERIRAANLDFTKYGWVRKAAPVIGISQQKVRGWIEEFAPDLLINAHKRKIPLVDKLVKSPY